MPGKFVPLKDRFDAKWRRDDVSGCWVWLGARTVNGYGKMYLAGQLVVAHRIGWLLYKAPLTDGLCLNHICMNKDCVNPDHLEEVTIAENTRHRNFNRHLLRDPTPKPPRKIPTLKERFDAKWKLTENGCWEWQGAASAKGYGRISVNAYPVPAYRVAYELYAGPIPKGLHIDHLCRNPRCVNPKHLEPVTAGENSRRGWAANDRRDRIIAKKTCRRGHLLEGDNLRVTPKQRQCRTCWTMARKGWRADRRHNGLEYT